jgi:hypothetical protein
MVLSADLDDPVEGDPSSKEGGLDVFESKAIPDRYQTAENILKCVKFSILHFSLGHSNEPKVTWTQVRKIKWMRRAYKAFLLEFSLDFPTIMTF